MQKKRMQSPGDAFGALFIGRFQPFHLGHMDAVRQILAKEKKILIGIGSALDSGTEENPFTAGERFQMINASLKEAGMLSKVTAIIPIPDINNSSLWVEHIVRLCPPFGNVYTGSHVVRSLFIKDARHTVKNLKMRKKISATVIRRLISNGKAWQKFVTSAVQDLLIKWDAGHKDYGN